MAATRQKGFNRRLFGMTFIFQWSSGGWGFKRKHHEWPEDLFPAHLKNLRENPIYCAPADSPPAKAIKQAIQYLQTSGTLNKWRGR